MLSTPSGRGRDDRAARTSLVGRRLGPYRLVAERGAGGMGTVYEARWEGPTPGGSVGDRVAVKVVHADLCARPGFVERFLREADLGRRVRHDNVVRTLDAGECLVDAMPVRYLVLEYSEGRTLAALAGELGRVPEELCRHVGCEILKGLGAIHAAGIVHRDVKPENVLITDGHVVKVTDLGVARMRGALSDISQTGSFVGSVRYAAPEQVLGVGVDARTDLHAVGLVLYELSTGAHPYDADDVGNVIRHVIGTTPRRAGEVNPQLSPFFDELLAWLLEKDRE